MADIIGTWKGGMKRKKRGTPLTVFEVVGDPDTDKQSPRFQREHFLHLPLVSFKIPTFQRRDS